MEVEDNESAVENERRKILQLVNLLPLSPVSVPASTSVMQFTASQFRLPHAALIFLHFYPRSTRGVVSTPYRDHHRRQYAPIRYN